MGKTAIEDEVLAELHALNQIVGHLVSGQPLKAVEMTSMNADDGDCTIATILFEEKEYFFVDAVGNDVLDNYISVRSSAYPEMAIQLPRPAFLHMGAESTTDIAKWRQDLC